MACEIHFGEIELRDDRGIGWDILQTEPLWRVDREDIFPSSKAYVRGHGNAAVRLKFRLTSVHATYFEQLNYRASIYRALLGTNLVSPRELWVLDPSVSMVPYSFGLSMCHPPKVVEEGHSEDGFILVMEYDFICDVLELPSLSSVTTPIPPSVYAPNLFIPNIYGLVLRRTPDNHYIRITWDFTTQEFVYDDLGSSAPSSANYASTLLDVEWPDDARGFGLYAASGTNPYALFTLTQQIELATSRGATASAFSSAYSLTKGLVFETIGTGPILNEANGERRRLTIDDQYQIGFQSP